MKVNVARLGGGPRKFSDFADDNGFTLEVNERKRGSLARYYVHFVRVEVAERGCLVGVSGNGGTVAEAIADYAYRLRGERLVHNAYTDSRREIQAPNEWIPEDFSEYEP